MSGAFREVVGIGGPELEVFHGSAPADDPPIVASHPADPFGAETVRLLSAAAGQSVISVNASGVGGSTGPLPFTLETVVDQLEQVRQRLGVGRWVFWGMSGGGWLGQLYGHRYSEAIAGLILESTCACYRQRVADPACALSPFHPAWGPGLAQAGLLSGTALEEPLDGVATEWLEVAGVGSVLRRAGGPALLVSPMPLSPVMRQMMPVFLRFDARPWLHTLRVPALVLHGTADPIVPGVWARAVHEAIAGSVFVAVEGASHVPTAQERPEAAAAVRRFLRELASTRP